MINVTKVFLPPLEEYTERLKKIWERNHVTNQGPFVLELEAKLREYLGAKHVLLINNGTVALQIAVKALDLKGEVITTPFSYVATTSSIAWEGCTPVFVDIDPVTLNINADLIEAAITEKTTAILPTHVYGIPCDVDKIKAIATKHGLKVIYDAAHAFAVKYKGQSLVNFGDVAMLSLHATKIFHTGEGGALVTNDDAIAHRIDYMRNFGHYGYEDFHGVGINGKVSEIHAAMGLSVLPYMDQIIGHRKWAIELYNSLLENTPLELIRKNMPEGVTDNYSYYPVLFPSEEVMLAAITDLKENSINARRYFYPSLNRLPYVNQAAMPVAEDISSRILCLPLSHEISEAEIRKVAAVVKQSVSAAKAV